jgi:hypothetical protein
LLSRATTIDNLKIITSFPYERLTTQITKSKVIVEAMELVHDDGNHTEIDNDYDTEKKFLSTAGPIFQFLEFQFFFAIHEDEIQKECGD